MSNDSDGARVGGWKLSKVESTQGKAGAAGKLKVTLEASKEEISTGSYGLGDVLSAFNTHQEGEHPVVLRILMPTDIVPSGQDDEDTIDVEF